MPQASALLDDECASEALFYLQRSADLCNRRRPNRRFRFPLLQLLLDYVCTKPALYILIKSITINCDDDVKVVHSQKAPKSNGPGLVLAQLVQRVGFFHSLP